MTEPFDRLESELLRMKPRALPGELVDRIDSCLRPDEPKWHRSDTCLLASMSLGALAACVIVAMLLIPLSQAPVPSAGEMNVAMDAPRAGDYPLAIARADFRLNDAFK